MLTFFLFFFGLVSLPSWHNGDLEDGSLCSHYEHTIAINEKGLPELLTYPGYVLTEEAE